MSLVLAECVSDEAFNRDVYLNKQLAFFWLNPQNF